MVLDEDYALIGIFGNEEEESQLYISYKSDSYERNDHNGANNSLMYILSNVMQQIYTTFYSMIYYWDIKLN